MSIVISNQSTLTPPACSGMENLSIFRKRLALTLASLNTETTPASTSVSVKTSPPTSRDLFGPPDPQQATKLVREIELKNALNFGKRFNFDIVTGEPFPLGKRRRMESTSSDEKDSVASSSSPSANSDEENAFEEDEEGYIWAETENEITVEHVLRSPPVSLLLPFSIKRRISTDNLQESQKSPQLLRRQPSAVKTSANQFDPVFLKKCSQRKNKPKRNYSKITEYLRMRRKVRSLEQSKIDQVETSGEKQVVQN